MILLIILLYLTAILGFRWAGWLRLELTNIAFLVTVAAALHAIFLYPFYTGFVNGNDGRYFVLQFLLLVGFGLGLALHAVIDRKLISRFCYDPIIPINATQSVMPWVMVLVLLFLNALLFVFEYYSKAGSLNPLVGIRNLFSGENSANLMWNTSGAENWGAGRGQSSSGGGRLGQIAGYYSRWFSLMPLLLLPFLGKRNLLIFGLPFLAIKLFSLTGGYTSRTAIVVWIGVIAFYCNDYVRKFRAAEVLGGIVVAFTLVMILHLGRLGSIRQSELSDLGLIFSSMSEPITATFEPLGWALRVIDTVPVMGWSEKVSHFVSYFGALIPRFVWPSKPFYSFEPDLTMMVTGLDISGNNPVRTFTIIAEGYLVGGYLGVLSISTAFMLFVTSLERFLFRFWEMTFVRYWFILNAMIFFRTSLFTLISTAFVLAILPVMLLGLGARYAVFHRTLLRIKGSRVLGSPRKVFSKGSNLKRA